MCESGSGSYNSGSVSEKFFIKIITKGHLSMIFLPKKEGYTYFFLNFQRVYRFVHSDFCV
jgi:hypothetical protein